MLYHTMAVPLEYINRSLYTIFHKCLILQLIFILHFPIMLALCLMLSMTDYAQNYAGVYIIGRSLTVVLGYVNKTVYIRNNEISYLLK